MVDIVYNVKGQWNLTDASIEKKLEIWLRKREASAVTDAVLGWIFLGFISKYDTVPIDTGNDE